MLDRIAVSDAIHSRAPVRLDTGAPWTWFAVPWAWFAVPWAWFAATVTGALPAQTVCVRRTANDEEVDVGVDGGRRFADLDGVGAAAGGQPFGYGNRDLLGVAEHRFVDHKDSHGAPSIL